MPECRSLVPCPAESGIRATRLHETVTNSAWCPFQTTRSPVVNSLLPGLIVVGKPIQLGYCAAGSLLLTAPIVSTMPSLAALSSTSRILSGCCRALDSRLPRPNSSNILSVPIDTRECVFLIRTFGLPALKFGAGTSTISAVPESRCWSMVFI